MQQRADDKWEGERERQEDTQGVVIRTHTQGGFGGCWGDLRGLGGGPDDSLRAQGRRARASRQLAR